VTTLLIAGSVLLASVQLASTFLLTRKNRAGWIASMAACAIGLGYDIVTYQYGFLPVCVLNFILAVRAWFAWKVRDEH